MRLASTVEDLADLCAAREQIVAGGLDVGDDEIKPLRGAGRRRGDVLAEDDGRGRARRGELDHAPAFAGKIGIEPPAELGVKRLGAIDVGDGDHDDFELHVDGPGLRDHVAGGAFLYSLGHDLFLSRWMSWMTCRESNDVQVTAKW